MRISDWSSDVCSSDLLNVKVKLVPNDKGNSENAPDFRLQAAGHDIGAAWNKTSEAGREYKSVTLDDPSFPAPVYARLIEGEDGTHDLIWSRRDRKSVVSGKCVSVRVDLGGRRSLKKTKRPNKN